jgi:hypothetical protein
MIVAVIACWWLYKKLTRKTAVKSATALLVNIKKTAMTDELKALKQLSACLRRVAISVESRTEAASLTGDNWLKYLDKSVEGTPFSTGVGQYLVDVQYRHKAPDGLDLEALITLCERWLKGRGND